jgi:hypothetical protein
MNCAENLTHQPFQRFAFEVSQRELGPDGRARFPRLNRSGPRACTAGQSGLTVDESAAQIRTNS